MKLLPEEANVLNVVVYLTGEMGAIAIEIPAGILMAHIPGEINKKLISIFKKGVFTIPRIGEVIISLFSIAIFRR